MSVFQIENLFCITHLLQKLIINGRADTMKRSCSDILMYFNAAIWPSSERYYRLNMHLSENKYR